MENEIMYIKLDDIIPNRFQPREVFNEEELNKLADSIRQHGVLEPILVRPISNKFEIIAGERRYKAAALAGLTKIPAIVKDMDDKESSIVAYIENSHRSNVSSIEEARTIDRIIKNNNMTQEDLSSQLGMSQSNLANKLRLLTLPIEVQEALMRNEISERHARSLLSVHDTQKQIELLNRIKSERMTVRELDSEIKKMNNNLNENMNDSFIKDTNNAFLSNLGNNEINQEKLTNNNNFEQFLNNYSNNTSPVGQQPDSNVSGFLNSNHDNLSSFLNNNEQNYNVPTIESSKEVDNNFTNFLNSYDKNYGSENNETSGDTTPDNSGFTSFLNNFDQNYSVPSESNKEESKEVNNNFTNFLNNYDKNYGSENNETSDDTTPDNSGFTNFLNNFDQNYGIPSNENINNGLTINDVNPPITSGFNANSYVEDNPNYVDVSSKTVISSIDGIINELKGTIDRIKTESVYKIDTEEINFDDVYQITIKIDKKDY